jgi:hypothetical protein
MKHSILGYWPTRFFVFISVSKIQAQSSPVNYIPDTPALFELTNLSQSNITSECFSTFAKR